MNDFELEMVKILGTDAFFSTDFNVTDNVKKLAFTANYLFTQLGMCKRFMDEDDKGHIDEIKAIATSILKGQQREHD